MATIKNPLVEMLCLCENMLQALELAGDVDTALLEASRETRTTGQQTLEEDGYVKDSDGMYSLPEEAPSA